jgi:mono/diheme cytochrome c family protein
MTPRPGYRRWLSILSISIASGAGAGLLAQGTRAPHSDASPRLALLQQYCVGCHNERAKAGGLVLNATDSAQIPANADTWEKVVRKLRAGAMPPRGAARPDRPALDDLASWLETRLDDAAQNPNPGPALLRRLNRAEYANAIHDSLDLDVDIASLLPADDSDKGFDNMARALRLSPALLDAYLSASAKVSRIAVGDLSITPVFTTYRVRPDLGQDGHIDGLPPGTRGGLLAVHNFPLDGDYIFKPRLALNTSAKVRGLDFENEFVITVDGVRIQDAKVGGPADEDEAALSPPDSEAKILARLQCRVHVSAGPHTVGVTFVAKPAALTEGIMQPFLRSNFDTQEQRGVPFVDSISIGGPFNATGSGDTPSRRRVFICRPANPGDEDLCARKILLALTRRAWRRPVTSSDADVPMNFYRMGRNAADGRDPFEAGVESALRFILTSPEFLFRSETDPVNMRAGMVHPVSDMQLASRLSFFLWSSIPDDELIDVAAKGKLHERVVLEQQVRRMLADRRSQALSKNFCAQWLYLRNLQGASRDLKIFPGFDDNLRQGFRDETELFFDSIMREDKSVLDFLSADYTFVNERLAKHYGITGVEGDYFRRVTLSGDERRGLLGQGSVLTVTSYATRTSPVQRGKWLLDNILGTPVPPPPPNVPALEEDRAGAPPRSVRGRMEQHRANPACAVCHNIMDPLGFALENFDATGAWRTQTEARTDVDASGELVDGSKVNGPVSLRAALLSRPELFTGTLTEKLLTYAIGRGVESYDMPAVRKIVQNAASHDNRFSSIVIGIVESVPFQMRRKEAAPESAIAAAAGAAGGKPQL